MRLEGVEHVAPGRLAATMVYEVRGQRFAEPFTANEIDDERLATMAAAQGCVVDAVLDDPDVDQAAARTRTPPRSRT